MANHEKEKLLREIEEGLKHSREIIGQIDKVLAQRSRMLSQRRLRPGSFGFSTLSDAGNAKWAN